MNQSAKSTPLPIVVGLGEILWDVFPEGPRFGGAPSNFACSIAELGQPLVGVHIVSAVGNDDLGRNAIAALQSHHVQVGNVQLKEFATGRVDVTLDASGVASYRFSEDIAWDHLSWTSELAELAANCSAVCFGTLAQRSERSRQTIQRFVAETPENAFRVLDINLRSPYFDDGVIQESLQLANVLKLNDDELPQVAAACGIQVSEKQDDEACLRFLMAQLRRMFSLQLVAVTRGPRGATLLSADETSEHPGEAVAVADTVGAGDAFTAAMTLGLLRGDPIEKINARSVAVAGFACTQHGGTMSFPEDLRIRFDEGRS